MNTIEKHFVTFFCPGTFVAEQETQEIDCWDVSEAQKRAKKVKVRYDATPYAFQFTTRSRGPDDLDSRVSERSPYYFVNCEVRTLKDVEAAMDPDERILRDNMKCNGIDRIATAVSGWKWSQPMNEDDVCLPLP